MIVRLNETSEDFEKIIRTNQIKGYVLTLDFINHKTIRTDASISDADLNSNKITFNLVFNRENFDLSGKSVYINVKKSDGTIVKQPCDVIDALKGIVSVSLDKNSTNIPGNSISELIVYTSNYRIASPKFTFKITQSIQNQIK